MLLMEEEHVAPEAPGLVLDGGGRDALGAGNLPERGAGVEAVQDGLEQIGALQPVCGGEGLCTEGPFAVMTPVPLNGALIE